MTQAADFGTQAHILIDQIVQRLEPEIPAEMVTVVENFATWRREAGLDIQMSEMMVYSAKYRYAGAMDAVATRDGQLVALDWKTSNGLYPEYALQVAAYAKALEEMTGQTVTEAWAIRFGKTTPEFEVRKVLPGCGLRRVSGGVGPLAGNEYEVNVMNQLGWNFMG